MLMEMILVNAMLVKMGSYECIAGGDCYEQCNTGGNCSGRYVMLV